MNILSIKPSHEILLEMMGNIIEKNHQAYLEKERKDIREVFFRKVLQTSRESEQDRVHNA
jgi:hypothetical protein